MLWGWLVVRCLFWLHGLVNSIYFWPHYGKTRQVSFDLVYGLVILVYDVSENSCISLKVFLETPPTTLQMHLRLKRLQLRDCKNMQKEFPFPECCGSATATRTHNLVQDNGNEVCLNQRLTLNLIDSLLLLLLLLLRLNSILLNYLTTFTDYGKESIRSW